MDLLKTAACLFLALPVAAGDFSVTFLPAASIRYRGEGKVLPESYVNRFEGHTSPLYRVRWRSTPDVDGARWDVSLLHTGVFGGGRYGREIVPNAAGGVYQENLMNVGFTNIHLASRRPLSGYPLEGLIEFTVAREIFKRKDFRFPGLNVQGGGLDDVYDLSTEGIGVGLSGRHSTPARTYARWEAVGDHLFQIFDAKTDASAGQLFRAEAAFGFSPSPLYSLEFGGFWQYWFLLGQGNRRLHVPSTDGAVISWNRQETRVQGFFFSLQKTFR
jgi:hypothetical protein